MHTFPDMSRYLILFVLSFTVVACGSRQTNSSKENNTPAAEAAPEQKEDQGFSVFLPSIATITTYDGERRLEEGFGFFVGENLVVALNSQFGNCNRALLQTWDGKEDEIVAQRPPEEGLKVGV